MKHVPTDALDAGLQVAAALDRAEIPYALGGALAYGQYAVARATYDIDVNVFVDLDRLDSVLAAFEAIDIPSSGPDALLQAQESGLIVLRYGDFRLDVFTPSIDFSWEAARTKQLHDVGGAQVWVLSAEALCVFKLLFNRGKDIVDLERLVAVRQEGLDSAYVRRHIVEMMGEQDERVATWDRLVKEFGA